MKITFFPFLLLVAVLATGCSKSSDSNNPPLTTCTWKTVFLDNFQRSDTNVGSNYMVVIQPSQTGGSGFADIYQNSLRISSDHVFWAVVYKTEIDGNKARVSVECTTPPSGGTCEFAVGGKFIYTGTMVQSGYFAGVMNNGIGIYKSVGGGMTTLATQTYQVQYNHSYRLSFIIDSGNLALTFTDELSGASATVTATDIGTILTGKQYSINGNSLGGLVDLLFNNYLIEICQ